MLRILAIFLLHCIILCCALPPTPALVVPPVLPPLNISSLPGMAKLNELLASAANTTKTLPTLPVLQTPLQVAAPPAKVPCSCGVFLTGQFTKGSNQQPTGFPALLHEYDTTFPCSPLGQRQCANKCLEVIAKHLPNSANIICGTIDRDCFKERAYLWTKNCNDIWENSNLSAGREFCCKDGASYKCPLGTL